MDSIYQSYNHIVPFWKFEQLLFTHFLYSSMSYESNEIEISITIQARKRGRSTFSWELLD